MPFPEFDPVLIHLGPLPIRWYALAYITGILIGWGLVRRLVQLAPQVATREQVDDFVTWATLGIVLGGRIGYVLFYRPGHYVDHPLEALYLWQGGMSFHGGAAGVIVGTALQFRHHLVQDEILDRLPVWRGLHARGWLRRRVRRHLRLRPARGRVDIVRDRPGPAGPRQ